MKKYVRLLCTTLCFILMFNVISFKCLAYNGEKKKKKLHVNARAYIALDADSKVVLSEKNSEVIMPMASTTKILTTLVALNHGDLNKTIEISKKAASIRGSTAGYRAGEKVTLKELLFGLMTRSGNDAAIAIGEGISGSVEEFVKLMNKYAMSLGLIDSHFHSPHGLDSPDHYSTAYDLAVLTAEAIKYPLFREIVGIKDVDAGKYGFTRSYHNINKILWQLSGANGVKTGYTGGAGKCLVTSVDIKGHNVIIVVLNCPGRWKETIKISDYVKENYEYEKVFAKGQHIKSLAGEYNNLKVTCDKDIIIPMSKEYKYDTKIKVPNEIKDDIKKGDKVGSIYIFKNDKLIYVDSLTAANNYKVNIIKRLNIFSL